MRPPDRERMSLHSKLLSKNMAREFVGGGGLQIISRPAV